MKLKRRLDCGSNGFHVASIPKAPRSIRRRAQPKRADEDGQICAFELLASLARKLLQESESSSTSSNASGNDNAAVSISDVKDMQEYEGKPVKKECLDHGSSEVSAVVSESQSQSCDQKCLLNELPLAEEDDTLERSSKVMDSGFLVGNRGDVKPIICKSNTLTGEPCSKTERSSPNFRESSDKGVEIGGFGMMKPCGSKDSMAVNPDRDAKSRSCRDHFPGASFSRQRNNTAKLGSSDDDENLPRCNKLSNKLRVYRPGTRIGDRRIRKLLTSKYWKTAPKLKDYEYSQSDGGMKTLHRKRKSGYNHERCQHDSLFKRRKFYDRSPAVTFDGGFSCESVTNSPEKSRNGDKSGSMSEVGRLTSSDKKNSNVKFSIKSFKVPEVFIEVSETATVGSLKRTVMDAVNAILGGGLRVGVLYHGKKIREDNRTLLQTGISSEDNLDSLGFTLEPSPVQAPAPVCSEDPPHLLGSDTHTPQPITRSPATPALGSGISDALTNPPPVTNPINRVETNLEQTNSHTDRLTNKTLPDSRAIVAVPALNVEALAVVPVNQKARRSELAQRRTRRPFSVAEVEALVQAVEELGTGRWRDVKLRSFENADHRTYVDLKDKWKTLVHTARIAPQQRRGEPVPQELLDRVLAAHAYWSQHQAKQQGKHQPGLLKLEAPGTASERTGTNVI